MTERPSGLGGELCEYFIDCIRVNIILAGALVVRYIYLLYVSQNIIDFSFMYSFAISFSISIDANPEFKD